MNLKRCASRTIFLYAAAFAAQSVFANDPDKMPVSGVQDQQAETRFVSNALPAANYGYTAFAGTNKFYVGDSVGGNAAGTLVRASCTRTNGAWDVGLTGIAPTPVTLNTVAAQANPLNNNSITNLTVTTDGFPVATVTANATKVYLVNNPTAAGDVVTQNSSDIQQAGGAGNTNGVVALAANQPTTTRKGFVFAAVKPNAAAFGAANSGFALLRIADDNLVLENAADGDSTAGNKLAYNIKLDANDALGEVSISRSNAVQIMNNPACDMYWDEPLQRLFIGLGEVERNNNANAGAVTGLLVGRLEDKTAGVADDRRYVIRAAVNKDGYNDTTSAPANTYDWTALFAADDDYNNVVGFKASVGGSANAATAISKVRTMHTSTGKDYVIVNGGSSDQANLATLAPKVYALPVVPVTNDGKAGILAKWDKATKNAFVPIAVAGDLVDLGNADQALAATVGLNSNLISEDYSQKLSDIHVIGDTVYVAVNGVRDQNHAQDAGIFASTALFYPNGTISAWTPWQRVDGNVGGVTGFGLDANTQKFWYLDDAGANVDVTEWSAGANNVHNNQPLSTALVDQKTGVALPLTSMSSYDGATPGFNAPNNKNYDQFTMMVGTQGSSVAMIQAGVGDKKQILVPTVEFQTNDLPGMANDNVFVFNGSGNHKDAALTAISPLTTSELNRYAAATETGYVFAGGKRGLSVLCRVAGGNEGKGFNNDTAGANGLAQLQEGLSSADNYPAGINWGWVQLTYDINGQNALTNIRKIVSDTQGFVYVLTASAIYRIRPTVAAFATQVDAGDGLVTAAVPDANFAVIFDLKNNTVGQGGALGALGVVGPEANTMAVGTYAATNANYNGAAQAFRLRNEQDELFDMIVVQKRGAGNNDSTILVATSRGVLISNQFADLFTSASPNVTATNPFFKLLEIAAGGSSFQTGPALKLEFVNRLRGGQLNAVANDFNGEGNLYVTAVNENSDYMAVYRFNVSGGTVTAFNEPYKVGANATDYFYKVGTIDPAIARYISADALTNFAGKNSDYGANNSSFVSQFPVTPNPDLFLNAGKNNSEINLNLNFNDALNLSVLGKNKVIDPASGAAYFYGDFGVLVNE